MQMDPFRPYVAAQCHFKLATAPWEQAGCAALRKAVFCEEQGVFEGHDRDEIDQRAIAIAAISEVFGERDAVVGTVRIDERDPGVWFGSRLAVEKAYRRSSFLGPELIRLAVGSARARGAEAFFAHVQSQNVPLFLRLHWHTNSEMQLHGRLHHFMRADFAHYTAIHDGFIGFAARNRSAA